MNKSIIFFILLISLFLQSCMLSAPANSRKSLLNNNLNSNNVNVPVLPTNFAATDINPYWFDTQKITGTMTINSNTQNIYYLRGQNIHNFLSAPSTATTYNYQKTFCIQVDFNNSTYYRPLWVRAIPLAISNFTTQSVERVLRVDIPNENDNLLSCGQAVGVQASYSPSTLNYNTNNTNKICTLASTCTGKITAQTMALATVNAGINTFVSTTAVDLSGAKLQIDLQSNVSSTTTLCDNSSCNSKGFDCCIDGQCVKDATQKSSAQNNMTEYNQAMSEYKNNPLSFLNWPNVFYICTNITHIPPPITPPSTTTPTIDAQTRVKTYLGDYQCISDVQSLLGYARCPVSMLRSPPLGLSQDPAYQFIKKSLARSCGCTASDAEMPLKCPDWGVRPLYSSSVQLEANIVDFYCYTPTPPSQFGPIVNLDVPVSNRTAPHRLFTADGANYNLITDMPKTNPAPVQEGYLFSYIDELNKMSPDNGSFNINSVLGSMSADLNHTFPAKMVTVELGKTYLLTAKSGLYTPCPKCAKDTWFQSFFPFVPSQKGVGLHATGFTTARDSYSDNSTLGNYEDTKFGRACFVPVTMLPFAHNKNSSLSTQRQNRLSTQAAYYINGYQRDWYGFNQGALIGSFDGVIWFAVGSGRRVTATSTKLFLAINAAFLDLADKTETIVNIVPDSINNVVANYDYDTTLPLNDAKQNQGGTCQKYHQCTTDTDCITQLGWEYVCADVSQYKTKWPVTDTNANEVANKDNSMALFDLLAATIDTRTSLRCVYRGAGAPCKGDAAGATALNDLNKKLFTCAPNFYCAHIDQSAFNNELVRSPNEPNNFLFGFDANVLGRPVNYVTGNTMLTATTIQQNIKDNAIASFAVATAPTDMGLCRPGKSLDSTRTLAQRHNDAGDIKKRTDYISQIANCDSSASTAASRFMNCPVIDTDSSSSNLNYLNYKTPTSMTTAEQVAQQTLQNSCGQESKKLVPPPAINTYESTFKYIESGFLDKIAGISYPMLAQDACLRRAGSVCNTDLDCGPNLMHEQIAAAGNKSAFGGTEAEMAYWSESLICSQGAAKPLISSPDYNNYKLNQNRCCREIGKDFTMYTSDTTDIFGPDRTNNGLLDTSKFSYIDPKASGRYSRYSVSPTALNQSYIGQTAALAAAGTHTTLGTAAIPVFSYFNEPALYQWKVFGETGGRTCCGGGFIRKFADGTHDWNKTGRLNLDAGNFTCLNYRSPLATEPQLGHFSDSLIRQGSFDLEFQQLCSLITPDVMKNGCIQIPYATSTSNNEFVMIGPLKYDAAYVASLSSATISPAVTVTGILDMQPDKYVKTYNWPPAHQNVNVPFIPTPVGKYLLTPSGGTTTIPITSDMIIDSMQHYGFAIYLPVYIQNSYTGLVHDAIKTVIVHYMDYTTYEHISAGLYAPTTTGITMTQAQGSTNCQALPWGTNPDSIDPASYDNLVGGPALYNTEGWCIDTTSDKAKSAGRPILLVKAKHELNNVAAVSRIYAAAFLEIRFKTMEEIKGTTTAVPGNQNYYLTKLGRLELLGIPQITYEPLYCNNNQENLVPGIFNSTLTTRTQIKALQVAGSNTYATNPMEMYTTTPSTDIINPDAVVGIGNHEKAFVYQDKVDHPAVFSSKDFTCCTPLGMASKSGTIAGCCSGFGAASGSKVICKLPIGTDLNVYFNRFVSNEGVGDTLPGANGIKGFDDSGIEPDSDFIPQTGEPKFRDSTANKIYALGVAYCDRGKVVTGGAFGKFAPEPGRNASNAVFTPISIVDSPNDSIIGSSNLYLGKAGFDFGVRWTHHYYCSQ